MNLLEFIASPSRGSWINEPGLEYWVKKWAVLPDVIILSAVHRPCDFDEGPEIVGAYWRFIRRYAHYVPFTAEQVLNKRLAEFYERLGWSGFGMTGCAAYASPLTMQLHGNDIWLQPYGSDEVPSKHIF
jgi:hypothetical protein